MVAFPFKLEVILVQANAHSHPSATLHFGRTIGATLLRLDRACKRLLWSKPSLKPHLQHSSGAADKPIIVSIEIYHCMTDL